MNRKPRRFAGLTKPRCTTRTGHVDALAGNAGSARKPRSLDGAEKPFPFRQLAEYVDLYDSAPVGYLTLSNRGRIKDINFVGAQLLGQSRQRLVKSPLVAHIAGSDRRKLLVHFSWCRRNKRRIVTELRLKRCNRDKPVYVELTSIPLRGDNLSDQGFKSVITDITARKRAELALRESEKRFHNLADTAPVMIWMSGKDNKYTYFNKPWLDFTGRTLERELGDGWAQGVHPADVDRCLKPYAHAFNARKKFELEYRLRRRDGEYRWVLHRGVPLFTYANEFNGYIGSCIDITGRRRAEKELRRAHDELENRVRRRTSQLMRANRILLKQMTARKRAEHKLRESEERHRLMIEGARDYAIFMLDRKGRVATWNAGAQEIKGYRPEEIIGRHFSCFYPRANVPNGEPHRLLEIARSTGRAEAEGWRIRKDGSQFWANVNIAALYDSRRQLRGFLKVTRDSTERRQAQEALRSNAEKLADFFDQAPFGLFWIGPKGRILRVNKAGLDLFGCAAEQCLDRRVQEFHVDPETVAPMLKRLGCHEVIRNHRARLRREDGTVRHVLIDANGLWEHHRLVLSRWYVRDITRRVELEREILAVAERERQRLGRDLHDELGQQLTGIEFLSQALAGKLSAHAGDLAERAREITQMVRQATNHTRELAHGLSPAELETGGLTGALRELARRAEKMFGITCRFRCRRFDLNLNPTFSIHLYRIAQEAIANAIKHGKASRVDIGLTQNPKRLVLGVKDNGMGMPTNPRKRKGMGLRVMQYRAGVIAGTLVFQRNAAGGNTVMCTVKNAFLKTKQRPNL